jgi:predicted lactoylglutathione lyase
MKAFRNEKNEIIIKLTESDAEDLSELFDEREDAGGLSVKMRDFHLELNSVIDAA